MGAKGALESGHEAEVFLMGEAVYLMKAEVADACNPVGWPNVGEVMRELADSGVPVFVGGGCAAARAVAEADLEGKNAQFTSPAVFADHCAQVDNVITV